MNISPSVDLHTQHHARERVSFLSVHSMFRVLFLASFQVSLVNGLPSSAYFHYHAENAISAGQWTDISGNGRHATVTSGSISQAFDENFRPYLYGSTSASMTFPVPPGSYTFFHRARYTGGTKRRIFTTIDHNPCNWLSGFHGGATGAAYHGTWITAQVDFHGTNWVISSDQYDLYRSNGEQRSLTTGVHGSMCNLGVNVFNSEESDWAISEVIMFDRELSLSEIQEVEGYLESAPTGMPTSTPSSSVPTSVPTSFPTSIPTPNPTVVPTVTPCSGYNVTSPAQWDSVTITSAAHSLVVQWEAASCTSDFVHFELCFRLSGGQLRCWNTIQDSDIFARTGADPNIGTGSLMFAAAPDTGSGHYVVCVVDDNTLAVAVYGCSEYFYMNFSALTAMPTATPTRLPTAMPTKASSMAPTADDLTNGHDVDDSDDDTLYVIIVSVLGVLCVLLLVACLYLYNKRREGDAHAEAGNEHERVQSVDDTADNMPSAPNTELNQKKSTFSVEAVPVQS